MASNNSYYPLPASYQGTVCRSCGAKITFVTTINGASIPLDLSTARPGPGNRWQEAQTHFASCPQGQAWSNRRAATPARAASAELGAAEQAEQLVLDGFWAPRKNGQGGG